MRSAGRILIFGLFSVIASVGRTQILLEEGSAKPEASSRYEINSSGHGFRQSKKVGVGFGVAGAYGVAGTHLELNFVPELGLLMGFGLGSGYQAFNMQVKKVLAGDSVMPYLTAGLARWYSVGEPRRRNSSQPGFLADRFLSGREKATGDFEEVMIYPSIGIQYLSLSGDWAGFSLYAEILLLLDVDDFASAPTGGLGMAYYF